MYKDIVVNLSLNPSRAATASYGISVARAFQAHLTGITFIYEPTAPLIYMDTSMPSRDVVFHREDDSIKFAEIARRFDLAIVGQAQPNKETFEDHVAETALFESARPVLFVPYIQTTALDLKHVTVCWDGSRAATRAIADAMPFLSKAEHIDILIMESERPKSEDLPGIDIARHLARHGLKVELKRIRLNIDVGNTILNHAFDAGTGLIVMGGYGHSRMREFILGGATRTLLERMTVPTLMSH